MSLFRCDVSCRKGCIYMLLGLLFRANLSGTLISRELQVYELTLTAFCRYAKMVNGIIFLEDSEWVTQSKQVALTIKRE